MSDDYTGLVQRVQERNTVGSAEHNLGYAVVDLAARLAAAEATIAAADGVEDNHYRDKSFFWMVGEMRRILDSYRV